VDNLWITHGLAISTRSGTDAHTHARRKCLIRKGLRRVVRITPIMLNRGDYDRPADNPPPLNDGGARKCLIPLGSGRRAIPAARQTPPGGWPPAGGRRLRNPTRTV
jgi:hypothetical protein